MFSEIGNNINWLVQCKKKVHYPVDQSDHAGLTAFEYGWKSFNNIYSEFKAATDREKMRACIKKYVNVQDFVDTQRGVLIGFCDIHHRIYMTDEQYDDLNPRISNQVRQLKESIIAGDSNGAMNHLLDCLYTIRNARIHGAFGTGKIRFSFLPKIIYKINIAILSAKLSLPTEILEGAIDIEVANQTKQRTQRKLC